VMVESSVLFCITIWLPRCRTWTKPCCSRIAHTFLPDSTRSLGNGHTYLSHEHFGMGACPDF